MPHKKYKGPGAANPHKRSDSLIKKTLILPQKRQYYKEVLALTFWKVSPKGRAFTLVGVPSMAVVAVVVIAGVAVAVVVAMVVAVVVAVVIITAATAVAPKKGSGKNPEKSSLQREGRLLSGLLTQDGARVGVIGTLIDISPAQEGQ